MKKSKLKIKKQFKRSWIDNFYRYIINYRELSEKTITFNWGFLKYYFLVSVLDIYEVFRLEDDRGLFGLLLIKKYNSENYISLTHFILKKKELDGEDVDLLQKIKHHINDYRLLGYKFIEVSFRSFEHSNIKLFKKEFGFKENKELILSNQIKSGNKDIITLTKQL